MRLTVSGGNLFDYEDFTITVTNVNRAPLLSAIDIKNVAEGETLTFTITATDPDGDAVTYSASNLPGGAAFDEQTRKFSWTPAKNQAGTYSNVLFTVTDSGDPQLSSDEAVSFTIEVETSTVI